MMCYLRHLLVFVHCAHLGEEGPIFTEEVELNNSDFSITPNKSGPGPWIRGNSLSGYLEDRVDQNFEEGDLMDIGVHFPRSTFYLFFILSGGGLYDAMRNARHGQNYYSWTPCKKLSSLEGYPCPAQARGSPEKAYPAVTNQKGSTPPQGCCRAFCTVHVAHH